MISFIKQKPVIEMWTFLYHAVKNLKKSFVFWKKVINYYTVISLYIFCLL